MCKEELNDVMGKQSGLDFNFFGAFFAQRDEPKAIADCPLNLRVVTRSVALIWLAVAAYLLRQFAHRAVNR